MFNRRILAALMAAVTLLTVLLGHLFAAQNDNTLFNSSDRSSFVTPDSLQMTGAARARAAYVNWNALSPQAEKLSLNLFSDVMLDARLRRVDQMANGGYVWVGDIEGEAGSSITLSVQNGVVMGSIYRHGVEWGVIRYAGEVSNGAYWIVELDPYAPQPTGRDYVIPPPAGEAASPEVADGAVCAEDGSEIGVMVVYTAEARDSVGGQAAIEALINQKISDMNSANAASHLDTFRWRLVHTMEVSYNESGSLRDDLDRLLKVGDGIMDEVHQARDTYKADLVALLVAQGNNNACGYAYQMGEMDPGFQNYSFAAAALDYPGDYYSCSGLALAHELGHTMGNAHDRAHSSGKTLFPYSYGFQSPTGRFRDIMSYDCPNGCPRINQWANPDVMYLNEPTGIKQAADLVSSMNQARVLVSNFRADCSAEPVVTPTAVPTATPLPSATPPPVSMPYKLFLPAAAKPTSGR